MAPCWARGGVAGWARAMDDIRRLRCGTGLGIPGSDPLEEEGSYSGLITEFTERLLNERPVIKSVGGKDQKKLRV